MLLFLLYEQEKRSSDKLNNSSKVAHLPNIPKLQCKSVWLQKLFVFLRYAKKPHQ